MALGLAAPCLIRTGFIGTSRQSGCRSISASTVGL